MKNWPVPDSQIFVSVFRLFFLQHCSSPSSQGAFAADLPMPSARKVPAMAAARMLILMIFFLMVLVSDAFDEAKNLNVTANLNRKWPRGKQ